jgi:3-deoxy-D-manno-octulosonic-acid transferase
MLNGLALCLTQSELDSRRLFRIDMGPDKVRTVGNIKFDRHWEPMEGEELRKWEKKLNLPGRCDLWIAGSTHEGEEGFILNVFQRLLSSTPRLRVIVAPRRIERAGEIFELSESMGLKTVLRSRAEETAGTFEVMVLDTLGELERIYGLGKISFVGGSLVPFGGHNLLEPAWFGQPVLFGPHTEDFDLMSRLLIEAGGGVKVKGEEELARVMTALLADREKLESMGRRAGHFVRGNRGALDRVMSIVDDFIQ